MRIDARQGARGTFIDLSTGKPLRWVIWYDTDTHFHERFATDPELTPPPHRRTFGNARLRFVPAADRRWQPKRQAPQAEWRPPRRIKPDPFERHWCEQYGCHREAVWEVATKLPLPPQEVVETTPPLLAADGSVLVAGRQIVRRFSRGEVVRTEYWCSSHYRQPAIMYPDGSVEHSIEVTGGRPL